MSRTETTPFKCVATCATVNLVPDHIVQVITDAGFEPDGYESWTKVLWGKTFRTRARIVICRTGDEYPLILSGSVMDLSNPDLPSLKLSWALWPYRDTVANAIKRIETYFEGP